MSTLRFLETLWPDGVPEPARLLVWTLADKRSTYFDSLDETADFAASMQGTDVYLGAGLAPAGLRRNQRAKADQVLGIPGLWLDIDVADPAHKKANLPDDAGARALIEEIGALRPPHVIIHSGHGYQLWWAFAQPWVFAHESERIRAKALAQGWNYLCRDLARGHGWDLDAVFDLARVMRLPGTVNHKGEVAVPVVVLDQLAGFVRETPEEWETFLDAMVEALPASPEPPSAAAGKPRTRANLGTVESIEAGGVVTVAGLRLDPAATPPFDKWEAAQSTDPKIGKTWERTRKDYSDQSASSWDMGLASYVVALGWTDQEITDLLIAARRKHGDDLKLRQDYYRRTIERARATVDTAHLGELAEDPTASASPAEVRAALSQVFGISIQRVVKYRGDPPTFVLELDVDDGTEKITLGGVEAIIGQSIFRNRVAASIGIIIPSVSKIRWEKRAQTLLNICETEDVGPDSSPAEAVIEWVREYIAVHRPSEDVDQALMSGRPYWASESGDLVLNLRSLGTWLRTAQGERVSQRELGRYMRMAGFERSAAWLSTENTTRSVWSGKLGDVS